VDNTQPLFATFGLMNEPSTDWREVIAPGEAERLEALAQSLAAMQKRVSARFGVGRALHRQAQGVLRARLDVDDGAPAWSRHGVFATARSFDVLVRLSNASALLQKDHVKDIRGFAWKVLGVEGEGALGGPVTSQDFLCINQETFGMKDADDFVALALAAAKGPGTLLVHLIRRHGFGVFGKLKQLVATINRPFRGFLSETFSTTLPIACGPYAVRLRIVPRVKRDGSPSSFLGDVKARLADGDVVFDVQLQPFVDEASTPIEDGSQPWDESRAPWTRVGTLTVPQQSLDDEAAAQRHAEAEQGRFDPWNALAVHRPLGHIMRARKAAYFASQQARGAA